MFFPAKRSRGVSSKLDPFPTINHFIVRGGLAPSNLAYEDNVSFVEVRYNVPLSSVTNDVEATPNN